MVTPVNYPHIHKWNGAGATFGVKSPKVAKGPFGKSWIWLSNAQGNIYNSIQFGWAVSITKNPLIFFIAKYRASSKVTKYKYVSLPRYAF